MTLLEAVRTRMRSRAATMDTTKTETETESRELTDRYTRLNERDAVAGLAQFDQAELTEIESFERSHRSREHVLNKLRYLRQREPVPGYDALEPSAVEEALTGADIETIKATREYENKMKKRPTALKAIDRARRASNAGATATAAPPLDASRPPVVGNGVPARGHLGSQR